MRTQAIGVNKHLSDLKRESQIWGCTGTAQARELAGQLVAKSRAMVMEAALFLYKPQSFA
jgi:hypothetical protein